MMEGENLELEAHMSRPIYAELASKPTLDNSFYSLAGDELAFYRRHTNIEDEDELKKHILKVQAKAYNIFGYPCIRRFSFLRSKISRIPAYKEALTLPLKRPGAIFLDIGCCFGNEIRKVVDDGWPVENAIASDLQQGFWDYGHELFKSTPGTFPASFVTGDVFGMLTLRDPLYVKPDTPRPVLKSLTSLLPLQGHVSAIHASAFFHLFSEEKQLELARRMATLLAPAPGSIILGTHGGRPEKGYRIELSTYGKHSMFCHSPESWRELWDGQVFKKGTVRVEAWIKKEVRIDKDPLPGTDFFLLLWSVTRL